MEFWEDPEILDACLPEWKRPAPPHDCEWEDGFTTRVIDGVEIKAQYCAICNNRRPCPGHRFILCRQVMSNGVTVYCYCCLACGEKQDYLEKREAINRAYRQNTTVSDLPLIGQDPAGERPCERCGAPYSEKHHWAPRHLFKDWWQWPTSNLCKDCHARWHEVTKTGAYRKRNAS